MLRRCASDAVSETGCSTTSPARFFFHHLTDDDVVRTLQSFDRLATRGIVHQRPDPPLAALRVELALHPAFQFSPQE